MYKAREYGDAAIQVTHVIWPMVLSSGTLWWAMIRYLAS